MTFAERRQQQVEDLLLIENRQERLAAVVDRARRRPPLPDSARTDANRVRGCVSAAWVDAELVAGRCRFRGDADGPLVRGLVSFLCEVYDDATPADILADAGDPLADLGLLADLTPTRRNGLASVRERIRAFAAQAA